MNLQNKDEQLEGRTGAGARLPNSAALRQHVDETVRDTPVVDMHTHLFAPQFGGMNLYGIDELLTYHYLVAETLRAASIAPAQFWNLSKAAQADLVWRTVFVENTPLSEAARGVVRVLSSFGLDPAAIDLTEARRFFSERRIEDHLDRVLDIACVSDIVMTNDPFDPEETKTWLGCTEIDSRFHAALRMDRLLNDWGNSSRQLAAEGYAVARDGGGATFKEVRRFLDEWIERMEPLYMAVSLPDDFKFPHDDARGHLIAEVVLPTAREHRLPFALMIGVRRAVNPALRLAGDGLGRADVRSIERLCAENPAVNFLVTMLSRENQHELCVAARKFANLMPFGCWWFLNNPSIVSEITRERFELLGSTFIPQHSDARVLDQLIYKWAHARVAIADALYEAYEKLTDAGRPVTRGEIERDVTRLFSGNFRRCVRMTEREHKHATP